MKLFGSTRSPYVRKVLIAAHETGTIDRIVMEPLVVTVLTINPPLLDINPLGQIPTLIPDNGRPLYDSAVICRYLDLVLGDGRLHPREVTAEIDMMRRLALGDGLSALLMTLTGEQWRDQPGQSVPRIAAIRAKLPRIFATLESEAEQMARSPFDMAQIALVAALCYLDFRLAAEGTWREQYPKLARWFAAIGTRHSVIATTYVDERSAADHQPTGKAGMV